MEKQARELNVELRKDGVHSYIVYTEAGGDFNDMTKRALYSMEAMVVFGCDQYGAKTRNAVSSFFELKIAHSRKKLIIPIRLGKLWPPEPDPDIDGSGRAQNASILYSGLSYLRWHDRKWDAAACAKEVKEALEFHRANASQVPRPHSVIPPSEVPKTPLVKEQIETHCYNNVIPTSEVAKTPLAATEYFLLVLLCFFCFGVLNLRIGRQRRRRRIALETCVVVFSPPSPLAVSPELTQFMSEIQDEAASKLLKMNALFVDGNDEDNIDLLLEELSIIAKMNWKTHFISKVKKILGFTTAERPGQSMPSSDYNFKTLKHFVLVGEGLPDDSWMVSHEEEVPTGTTKSLRSKVLDMIKYLKHMPNPPKISVALKYGAETIKKELNQEELVDINAVTKDIFNSNNTFVDVLRSLQVQDGSTADAKIEFLMKNDPTMTWEHKTLSNLRLTVDDLPNMYALKEDVSSCLAKGINACFPIMPMSDYMNDEDVYHRARALVYHCCKDLGHTLNKNHMRQGLHYVCDDAKVNDLVKALKSQEGDGIRKAVIWIHVRSPLDLSALIKSDVSNKMKVVYLMTKHSAKLSSM